VKLALVVAMLTCGWTEMNVVRGDQIVIWVKGGDCFNCFYNPLSWSAGPCLPIPKELQ
jgi:hypothetical protein